MAKARICGAEIPKPIGTTFCILVAIHDVITHANIIILMKRLSWNNSWQTWVLHWRKTE